MTGVAPLALIQADPEALALLGRIASSQIVIAAILALVGLVLIGAMLYTLHLMRRTQQAVRELMSRVQPVIDSANGIAANANQLSDNVKRRADEVIETVHELNERLRGAAEATEDRVREFGAVLEVVREETESILLDGAATARGVHVAAERLREPRARRRIEPAAGPAESSAARSSHEPRMPVRKHPEE